MLAAALAWAALGWRVLPLHQTDAKGVCTCRARSKCDRSGKHPRIEAWQTNATIDEAIIRAWWAQWPRANIGGMVDDRIILDLDPRNGSDETLHGLLQMHPDRESTIPKTWRHATGGGGQHIVFGTSDAIRLGDMKVRIGTNALGDGVDVKHGREMIVLPPSLHKSGARYRIDDHPHEAPATLPLSVENELAALYQASRPVTSSKRASEDAEGYTLLRSQLRERNPYGLTFTGKTGDLGDIMRCPMPNHADRNPSAQLTSAGLYCIACGSKAGLYGARCHLRLRKHRTRSCATAEARRIDSATTSGTKRSRTMQRPRHPPPSRAHNALTSAHNP
jgi:hypothetical protein